jgi:hypothetical protein
MGHDLRLALILIGSALLLPQEVVADQQWKTNNASDKELR